MKLLEANKNVIFGYTICLFAFTISMWNNLNTITIYPIIVSWLLLNNWNEKLQMLRQNKFPFLILIAVYLLFLSNFLFSDDFDTSLSIAIKALPLVIFSLVFLSTPIKYYKVGSVFTSLIAGVVVMMFVCWGRVFFDILSKRDPIDQATYFLEWIYSGFNLVKPFNAHPSYVGVLVVLSIIILMSYKGFETFRKEKFLYRFLLAIMFFFTLQTSSRISLLALFIFLSYHFFKSYSKKSIIQYVSLVIILILASLKFDYLKNKLLSVLKNDGSIVIDRWPRWVGIWEENKFWGNSLVGVGKEKAQFIYNEAYFKNGFHQALSENYNAHNQYLDFFVSNGIIGLVIFVTTLVYFFWKTKNHILPVSFILIVALFCVNETIFGRSSGLIFFSFFYSFFYINFRNNA